MANAEHPTPRPGLDVTFEYLFLVVVILFAAAFVAVGAVSGWLVAGWLGLILGIVIVIVAIPVVSLAVWAVFLVLIKLTIFLLCIGPRDLALIERETRPASAQEPLPARSPQLEARRIVLITATLVLWAIFGLPALCRGNTVREFCDLIPAVVFLPFGVILMLAWEWFEALAERLGCR
jgi:ABC-type transport system involved in multi-copper enzyme maturation permease subunit